MRDASPDPPGSEEELIARARSLSGLSLGEIARGLGVSLPESLRVQKGLVGLLLERCLGASAKSSPVPDFEALGVELKTVPIRDERPRESMFVCSASAQEIARETWATSRVRRKLMRVLLVPVEASPEIPLADRRIGTPLLWTPAPDEEAALRADWEDLADLFAQGLIEAVTARRGRVLQVRPKARRGSDQTSARSVHGDAYAMQPKGFYLRRRFTEEVLARRFAQSR